MRTDKYDQSAFLVLKAAYAYYIDEKPQSEIAREMGISITTVSRLIKKAKEDHVIEFVIRDSLVECLQLGARLKELFHLKEVIIASGGSESEEPLKETTDPGAIIHPSLSQKMVALEAARYLQRIIKKDDILGITWGSTVYEMINYLNAAQRVDATFLTLHGSLVSCKSEWDVRTLVIRLAKAFSGTNYMLLTEALLDSAKTAGLLKQEKNIAFLYKMFDRVNISVNGIGSLYPKLDSILATPSYIPEENVAELVRSGAVGDIALRFFDKEGKECKTSLVDRTLSIDFDQFKRIPHKITIASGVKKAYTVYYALKGGLIDVLIIDKYLASRILEIAEEEQGNAADSAEGNN